jgi:hypothetical protein
MSILSLSLDSDSEGKPLGWRRWWDRTSTPSNSRSPSTDGHEEKGEAIPDDDHEKEVAAVADDGQDEEEEEEDDDEIM